MFWIPPRALAQAALATILSVGAAQAITAPAIQPLEFPLEYDETTPTYQTAPLLKSVTPLSKSIGASWQGQVSPRTGLVHTAWGTGFSLARSITTDVQATQAARDVLGLAGDLLGARPDNVELRGVASMPGKWAVHFRQVVDGIQVYTSDAWVLLSDRGIVIALGSDFFPERSNVKRHAALSGRAAINAAAGALSTSPRMDHPITTELVYVPAPSGATYELRLAYRVVFDSDEPFGQWESFIDASTGATLGRRNFVYAVNVTGVSQGDVEDFGYCDPVATEPFRNQMVSISGGGSAVTDATGTFDIANGGTAPVTVTAQFVGPYVDVNRFTGGPDASFTGASTPGTPLTINWTDPSSRPDERDAFFHVNRVHDFMKAIDPTMTQLDYPMVVSVGHDDAQCDTFGGAWWDGSGLNFCVANGARANTGQIGSVIYHEYGHGVTKFTYMRHGSRQPPRAMHEGNSDVLSNLIERRSEVGIGYHDCAHSLRDSQNLLHYPADTTGNWDHDGQIIAGFIWDSRSLLLSSHPDQADSIIQHVWHYSLDLGCPQSQPDQVLWSFFVDDDDENLNNGTPHYNSLRLAAWNHGFSVPPLVTSGLTRTAMVDTYTQRDYDDLCGTTYFLDGDPSFDVSTREDITRTARALMSFESSDIQSWPPAQTATLRLYAQYETEYLTNQFHASRITENWDTTRMNWCQRLQGTSWCTPGVCFTSAGEDSIAIPSKFNGGNGDYDEYVDFDVTAIVQAWQQGAPNDGICVWQTPLGGHGRNQAIVFTSKEGARVRSTARRCSSTHAALPALSLLPITQRFSQ